MRRYNRELPVPMNEAEKVEKGEVLANLELKVADGEAEIESVKSQAKAHVKMLSETVGGQITLIRKLAREVESGAEFRTVEVEERLSENSSEVETFRKDTGEVIESRAAREEDRQASFEDIVDETLEKVAEETTAAEALGEQDEPAEEVDGSEFFDSGDDTGSEDGGGDKAAA